MTLGEKQKNARPFSRSITANKQNIHAPGGREVSREPRLPAPLLLLSGTARPQTGWKIKTHSHLVEVNRGGFALALNRSLLTLRSSRLSGLFPRRPGNGLEEAEGRGMEQTSKTETSEHLIQASNRSCVPSSHLFDVFFGYKMNNRWSVTLQEESYSNVVVINEFPHSRWA